MSASQLADSPSRRKSLLKNYDKVIARDYAMSSDSDDNNEPWPRKRRRINSKINNTDSIRDESDHSKRANTCEAAETSWPVESQGRRLEKASDEAKRPSSKSPAKLLAKSLEKVNKEVTATSSRDNNDEHGEQCPICLMVFVNQEVASPSSCQHFFCFSCLIQWSKRTNTCPVDRKSFNFIDARPKFGDKVQRHVPVQVAAESNSDVIGPDYENESDDDDFLLIPRGLGIREVGLVRALFVLFSQLSDQDLNLSSLSGT